MTRDAQHSLEVLRPARAIRNCQNATCGIWPRRRRRAVAVVDGRALCVQHASIEFADNIRIYLKPGVVPSDARE